MADLTQTAASVGLNALTSALQVVQVGESVTQGEPGYVKSSDSKYWRADADAEESAEAAGIFLTGASTDGYAVLVSSGSVDLGATLTVGETYVVSTNVGKIAPIGDLATGDYVTHLGVATTASNLSLEIKISGIAKP